MYMSDTLTTKLNCIYNCRGKETDLVSVVGADAEEDRYLIRICRSGLAGRVPSPLKSFIRAHEEQPDDRIHQ